jgi:hypothetical protein
MTEAPHSGLFALLAPHARRTPSPHLLGEGWDEGRYCSAQTRGHAPSPGLLAQSDPARRGEERDKSLLTYDAVTSSGGANAIAPIAL